jgi:hypothetical protein
MILGEGFEDQFGLAVKFETIAKYDRKRDRKMSIFVGKEIWAKRFQ